MSFVLGLCVGMLVLRGVQVLDEVLKVEPFYK